MLRPSTRGLQMQNSELRHWVALNRFLSFAMMRPPSKEDYNAGYWYNRSSDESGAWHCCSKVSCLFTKVRSKSSPCNERGSNLGRPLISAFLVAKLGTGIPCAYELTYRSLAGAFVREASHEVAFNTSRITITSPSRAGARYHCSKVIGSLR